MMQEKLTTARGRRGAARQILACALPLLIVATLAAQPNQITLNFPVTQVLASATGVNPAEVIGTDAATRETLYPADALFTMIIPGAVIDGISDGRDVFPPLDARSTEFIDDRRIEVHFSVAQGSKGAPSSAVRAQFNGNGAASDTFAIVIADGDIVEQVIKSDHQGIGEGDDIIALMWSESPWTEPLAYPVYFTTDDPTANNVPVRNRPDLPLSGGTIFVAESSELVEVYRNWDELGLLFEDNIDALAVDAEHEWIVYSLDAASPSLVGLGYTPGDLFRWFPDNSVPGYGSCSPLAPWASWEELDLESGDIFNGLRIGDPLHDNAFGSYLPSGFPASAASVDDAALRIVTSSILTDGGWLRRVAAPAGTLVDMDLDPGLGNGVPYGYAMAAYPGIPGDSQALASGSMFWVFDPLLAPALVIASSSPTWGGLQTGLAPRTVPVTVPIGPWTFQGLTWEDEPNAQLLTTNAITLVGE